MEVPKSINLRDIARRYREEYRPRYEKFVSRVQALLEEMLTTDAGFPIDHFERRVKTVDSFLKKIERKQYKDPFREIKDCAGLRIITTYPDTVDQVAKKIREEFNVDEDNSLDKIDDLGDTEFGYRSVHLIVSLPKQRASLLEWKPFADLCAEIQIRNVLQHAWATLSYDLTYKSTLLESREDLIQEIQRETAIHSAALEGVEKGFTRMRNMMIREAARENADKGSQPDKSKESLSIETLRNFMEHGIDLQKWERFGVQAGMEPFPDLISRYHSIGLTILLRTLQTIGIFTIAEFKGLFSRFEEMADQLQQFVNLIKDGGQTVSAVPVEILILLSSLSKPDAIPPDFDWGGTYEAFYVEALQKICKLHNE